MCELFVRASRVLGRARFKDLVNRLLEVSLDSIFVREEIYTNHAMQIVRGMSWSENTADYTIDWITFRRHWLCPGRQVHHDPISERLLPAGMTSVVNPFGLYKNPQRRKLSVEWFSDDGYCIDRWLQPMMPGDFRDLLG